MGELLAVGVNVAIIGVLLNSIVRFWSGPADAHQRERDLGGVSSFFTLLFACVLYSGEFARNATAAIHRYVHTPTTVTHLVNATNDVDGFFIRVANVLNLGPDIGSRPNPSLRPMAFLVGAYVVRAMIFRYLERRNRTSAAVTASVYWSHFTAYGMLIAFLVLTRHWQTTNILVFSLVLVLIVPLVLAGIASDAVLVGSSFGRSAKHWFAVIGKGFVQIAAGIAAIVRAVITKVGSWYNRNVHERVQDLTQHIEKAAETADKNADARLNKQNERHSRLFDRKSAK